MINLHEALKNHNLWDKTKGKEGEYANLQDANFRHANRPCVNLKYANLPRARMQYARMPHAKMRGANMQGVNLMCANLKNANMEGADITGAILWDCIGDGKRIKNIDGLFYEIAYTAEVLQIACINHTIKKWKNFTDDEIYRMDGDNALEFWKEHKDYILTTIKEAPAQ
jgi:uncharacterized protein YjbI with pentapeptide repeats